MQKTTLLAIGAIPLFLLLIGAAVAALTTPESDQPKLTKVCDGLQFPEGPAWDGKGNLAVSNCNANYITKIDENGLVTCAWVVGTGGDSPVSFKKTNGMSFYKDGSLFICDFGRNAIMRLYPDKHCEVYADNFEGQAFKGPNDLAFDPKGNLYFTDPNGSGKANPIGCVYMVEADTRKVRKVAEGLAYPNGLALTADAKHLYICESQHNRILRYDIQPDGMLGAMAPFADLSPDGPGEPDGMALDAKGNLWIAHYGTHHVIVVNPQGRIFRTIVLPHFQGGGPTNIEFAGKDLKTVYITDPGADCLWKMHSDVAGLPLFSPPDGK
jgi:gluconolactonase